MKNENNQQCDPCEQQFENNVDKMVNEVEGYTSSDHKARQKEVDGAFDNASQSQHKENKENGQSYGIGNDMGASAQQQKTQPHGATAQGQNSQKEQSYGAGSKMQGQQNSESSDRKSGQTADTAAQGQSGQWKGNTSSNDKSYGQNSGTGSANGQSYGNPTDRHEHAKEGDEAYAGKNK